MSSPIIQNELDLKYSFLRVRREKESIILGISPTNKTQQEIIKVTKNLSTVQNAGKGGLLSFKKSIVDQLQIDEKVMVQNLVSLVNNQFLCQIPVFEFEPSDAEIHIVPYFITHPGDDKNFSIANLFEELIVCSFKALKYWYEAKAKVSKDDQFSEFDWYLSGNTTPFKGSSNIFNCYQVLKEFHNGIPIYDEVISYIAKDIERRFIELNLAINLNNFGILFIKTREVHEIFENAESFMHDRMIEPMLLNSNYRIILEPTLIEKKLYYEANDFPFKTTKYSVDLAKQIRQIKEREDSINPNELLSLNIIIELDSSVDNYYQNIWKDDCENVKKEFKRNITAPSSKWTNLITFIQHSDSMRYPPDVWKDILVDRDIYYIKWQAPKSTVHIFTGREHSFIRSLVVGMITISSNEHWKAVALKYLIDKNEKTLRPLLIDANFSVIYQELNKKVYTPYVPWYFRILMFIPLQSLLEIFYEKAREKIKHEQDLLSFKNEAAIQKINKDVDRKKEELVNKVKNNFFTDSMKRVLDNFYLKNKVVPSLKEIQQAYPEIDNIIDKLRSRSFRIISLPVRGGDNVEVIMYPDDEQWRMKKDNLISSLESLVADRNPHLTSNMDMAKIEKIQNLLDILAQEV